MASISREFQFSFVDLVMKLLQFSELTRNIARLPRLLWQIQQLLPRKFFATLKDWNFSSTCALMRIHETRPGTFSRACAGCSRASAACNCYYRRGLNSDNLRRQAEYVGPTASPWGSTRRSAMPGATLVA